MSQLLKFPALPLLAAGLLCALPARAQSLPDAVPTVEVKAAHTRLLPYKELFYPMAKAVQQSLAGRAALAVQLRPARPGVRTDDLAVWLEGGGESLPVRADAHGLYIVPVADRIAAQDGSFSINKKPSDLRANLVLVPTLAPDAWTMGEIRRLLHDVHATLDPLVPWHHRFLMWAFTRKLGVSVCSLSPSSYVDVRDGERLLASYPTSEPARNHANAPVYCHRFTGNEDFDPRARLVLPEDAQVLLI
ncbi:hypothetical protein LK542_16065 [Massilia sp. IC2-477]|uniref:hypothetical protein n=1 Tax=unclassified Massilia TaxID=2609279 RepID=UPI001D0FBABD|nr:MULTISPECIES: hypothetical protein [unclassified Massilia]MCC2957134.1 hypothetical protein [Massilia sp. IC2-477]MCC2970943.1 hypothetical protein [Massilia sp. IC2-476]